MPLKKGIEPDARDIARADKLREEFDNLPALAFDKLDGSGIKY